MPDVRKWNGLIVPAEEYEDHRLNNIPHMSWLHDSADCKQWGKPTPSHYHVVVRGIYIRAQFDTETLKRWKCQPLYRLEKMLAYCKCNKTKQLDEKSDAELLDIFNNISEEDYPEHTSNKKGIKRKGAIMEYNGGPIDYEEVKDYNGVLRMVLLWGTYHLKNCMPIQSSMEINDYLKKTDRDNRTLLWQRDARAYNQGIKMLWSEYRDNLLETQRDMRADYDLWMGYERYGTREEILETFPKSDVYAHLENCLTFEKDDMIELENIMKGSAACEDNVQHKKALCLFVGNANGGKTTFTKALLAPWIHGGVSMTVKGSNEFSFSEYCQSFAVLWEEMLIPMEVNDICKKLFQGDTCNVKVKYHGDQRVTRYTPTIGSSNVLPWSMKDPILRSAFDARAHVIKCFGFLEPMSDGRYIKNWEFMAYAYCKARGVAVQVEINLEEKRRRQLQWERALEDVVDTGEGRRIQKETNNNYYRALSRTVTPAASKRVKYF